MFSFIYTAIILISNLSYSQVITKLNHAKHSGIAPILQPDLKTRFVQILSMDGTETGNGGFVINCKTKQTTRAIGFLDIYGLDIQSDTIYNSSTPYTIVAKKIELAKILNANIGQQLEKAFEKFKKNYYVSRSFIHTHPDVAAHISLIESEMFANCKPVQVFSRISDSQSKQTLRYILLRPDLFVKLNMDHKASAIFHELTYDVVFSANPDIDNLEAFKSVIELNRFFFQTSSLANLSTEELQNLEKQLNTLLSTIQQM